jgi:hypothetical protein
VSLVSSRLGQQPGRNDVTDRLVAEQHATAHANESDHPIIRSAEQGEDWSWCYVDKVAFTLARR